VLQDVGVEKCAGLVQRVQRTKKRNKQARCVTDAEKKLKAKKRKEPRINREPGRDNKARLQALTKDNGRE